MSNKSDELRSRLPRLTAELDEAIGEALKTIGNALSATSVTQQSDLDRHREAAWRKGLADALLLLRPARAAHEQFRAWIAEVIEQEVDHCGLTAAEREDLFARAGRD